jgi:hypothetical protein
LQNTFFVTQFAQNVFSHTFARRFDGRTDHSVCSRCHCYGNWIHFDSLTGTRRANATLCGIALFYEKFTAVPQLAAQQPMVWQGFAELAPPQNDRSTCKGESQHYDGRRFYPDGDICAIMVGSSSVGHMHCCGNVVCSFTTKYSYNPTVMP